MRTASVVTLALVVSLASAPIARGDVKVERSPAKVQRKTFDPKNPPADLPPMTEKEHAFTTFYFDCATDVAYEARQRDLPGGRCRAWYVVRRVTITVGLTVVIWLPDNATAKLKAHEEGHREIAEMIYKDAEQHARTAAAKLDGLRVEAEGLDCKTAVNRKLADLNKMTCEAYLERTNGVATRVQEVYDELTQHGVRPLPDEATAIAQAFIRQAEEAKRSTHAPATRPKPTSRAAAPMAPTTKPTKPR